MRRSIKNPDLIFITVFFKLDQAYVQAYREKSCSGWRQGCVSAGKGNSKEGIGEFDLQLRLVLLI
jgi:hypothetical protein